VSARRISVAPALLAVLVVFGLLYAWDLYEAIANLVLTVQQRSAEIEAAREFLSSTLDLDLDTADPAVLEALGIPTAIPWSALVMNVLTPVLVFVAALLLARRRPLWQRALLLLAGLAIIAVVTLSLTAYVRAGGL
jgi:hypothetical protein